MVTSPTRSSTKKSSSSMISNPSRCPTPASSPSTELAPVPTRGTKLPSGTTSSPPSHTPGNAVPIIGQKSLLGHVKGGSAAWPEIATRRFDLILVVLTVFSYFCMQPCQHAIPRCSLRRRSVLTVSAQVSWYVYFPRPLQCMTY